MKEKLRKLAEKLSNFKLLARIMICVAAVVVVVAVCGFLAFQYSRGIDPDRKARICAFGAQGEDRQLIGMAFFFVLAVTLILAIVVAYQSKEFAFPKTKMTPNKSLPVLVVVNGGFSIVAAVFCVLAVVVDVPKGTSVVPPTEIAWAWYVICVFYALLGICQLCFLFPVLKSHYYMPKFEEEKK